MNLQNRIFMESKIEGHFADGISGVHVTGDSVNGYLARVDFMTLQPHLNHNDGLPIYDVKDRIIMPLKAFLEGLRVQEDIVKQLIDSGIITFTPDQPVSAAGTTEQPNSPAEQSSDTLSKAEKVKKGATRQTPAINSARSEGK